MGNPNPKIENLNHFEDGHEKIGGREKGTPNKITGQIILDRLSDKLQEEKVTSNENGTQTKKTELDLVLTGLLIRAELGDPKAIDLIFKAYGLIGKKVELSGDVKLQTDIPTDQLFKDLGALANDIRDRTSPNDSSTSKV